MFFLANRCNDYNIPLNEAKQLCWNYANVDGSGYKDAIKTIESAYNNPGANKYYNAVPIQNKSVDGILMSKRDSIVYNHIANVGINKNLLTDQYELTNGELLNDETINMIAIKARVENSSISSKQVYELIASPFTKSFHPFAEYLKSINNIKVVNGTINKVLDCMVLDNHHADYKERIVKKWFGGIMGTLKGSYSVMTLVLVGWQGCGKTTFFRGLLPPMLKDYFAEGGLVEDKDVMNLLCSNILYYDDEFTSKNKTEASIYKKMSSADKFTYRKPYGRTTITRNRTAILCGSANEPDVISDHTGNRRILATRIKSINHNALNNINLNDFYRELLELHNNNPIWWHLSKEDIEFMNNETVSNTAVDEYLERVSKYTIALDFAHVSTTEVERHICYHDSSFKANSHKTGRALAKLYGNSFLKKVNGNSIRGYPIKLIP